MGLSGCPVSRLDTTFHNVIFGLDLRPNEGQSLGRLAINTGYWEIVQR